eukprot:1185174-Rhodomonas_salina.1
MNALTCLETCHRTHRHALKDVTERTSTPKKHVTACSGTRQNSLTRAAFTPALQDSQLEAAAGESAGGKKIKGRERVGQREGQRKRVKKAGRERERV